MKLVDNNCSVETRLVENMFFIELTDESGGKMRFTNQLDRISSDGIERIKIEEIISREVFELCKNLSWKISKKDKVFLDELRRIVLQDFSQREEQTKSLPSVNPRSTGCATCGKKPVVT
jgi:hypothetical protein